MNTSHPPTIGVVVNGQAVALSAGTTLEQLIAQMGTPGRPCAAEVNQHLVPKREHAGRQLADGDRVELVSLVGGG